MKKEIIYNSNLFFAYDQTGKAISTDKRVQLNESALLALLYEGYGISINIDHIEKTRNEILIIDKGVNGIFKKYPNKKR